MNFDEILALIVKKELALSIIRNSKNQFACRDRYKQVKKIERRLALYGIK